MIQIQPQALKGRGWMTFSIAAGAVLHFGGANAGSGTAGNASSLPTAWVSGGDSTAASLLAKGIPQNPQNIGYQNDRAQSNYHEIKAADIYIISAAGVGAPPARFLDDGSVPTAALGTRYNVGDSIQIRNGADQLFKSKIFNNGAGAMVVEVQVWE
jgi:hypothetical protein